MGILMGMCGWTPGAMAGELKVTNGAASTGNFGLEVTVGKTCTQDDVLIMGGTVSGDSAVACNSLTANNVEVIAPGAVFRSGGTIVLGGGFSVAAGATFAAQIEPFAGTNFAAVRNNSPNAETSYLATFDLMLDDLNLAASDALDHLIGYSQNGVVQFRAVLRWNMTLAENRLALFVREDDGGYVSHPTDFLLEDGYNNIQIYWRAGDGDGWLLASINGGSLSGLEGLSNSTGLIDYVRWGLIDGTFSTTTGSIAQDDFHSARR